MGTFERVSLFYGVGHEQVYAALEEFWLREKHTLEPKDSRDVNLDSYALHERRGDWTVLQWTRGWEWDLRRRAQLHVSRAYDCPGLLVFLYDDDFWGYELFHHGEAIDQFQQETGSNGSFFDDLPCEGRPPRPRHPRERTPRLDDLPYPGCQLAEHRYV